MIIGKSLSLFGRQVASRQLSNTQSSWIAVNLMGLELIMVRLNLVDRFNGSHATFDQS